LIGPFRKLFTKEISGNVKMSDGKLFGFIEDIFIHPSLIKKYNLANGSQHEGIAIKSYNQERKKWGWKLI
jgi:hypothetical protein